MTLDDPITLKERYMRATTSSNLAPGGEGRTDLDVLIAAGLAAQAKPDRIMALKVQRMIDSGQLGEMWAVVEFYDDMLNGYCSRKGRRPMPKAARRALVAQVLHWLMYPGCDYCGGTGKIAEEGTGGRLAHTCTGCHGAGIKPLARAVPHAFARHSLWLVDEINQSSREAIKQMRFLLNGPPT